jgi:hypothetical protein
MPVVNDAGLSSEVALRDSGSSRGAACSSRSSGALADAGYTVLVMVGLSHRPKPARDIELCHREAPARAPWRPRGARKAIERLAVASSRHSSQRQPMIH